MQIEEQLKKYFKDQVDVEVASDTLLVEDNVIDSMGIVELLAYIESVFGVTFDPDDLTIENFNTIHDIRNLIVAKQEAV